MASGPIRFDVTINGEHICIAGVENFGVLSAIVTWVMRDPGQFDSETYSGTLEKWSKEKCDVNIGGMEADDFIGWFHTDLKAGDEITIKLLGDGRCDPPVYRNHRRVSDGKPQYGEKG